MDGRSLSPLMFGAGGAERGLPVGGASMSEPQDAASESSDQAPFFDTNGRFTTRAGTGRLRMSISTAAPTSTDGGRKPRAIPCSRMGEKLPLVTSPAGLP